MPVAVSLTAALLLVIFNEREAPLESGLDKALLGRESDPVTKQKSSNKENYRTVQQPFN